MQAVKEYMWQRLSWQMAVWCRSN